MEDTSVQSQGGSSHFHVSVAHDRFFKFISSVTLVNLLVASLAPDPIPHLPFLAVMVDGLDLSPGSLGVTVKGIRKKSRSSV